MIGESREVTEGVAKVITSLFCSQDFIPHMAEKYNFEFELVQYKWPRWLHQQTVKQRIIWGYVPIALCTNINTENNSVTWILDSQKIDSQLKKCVL